MLRRFLDWLLGLFTYDSTKDNPDMWGTGSGNLRAAQMPTIPVLPVLPGLPAEFANLPSVRMVPPPQLFLPDVVRVLRDATADLGPFKHRLAWIATEKGVNLAYISKVVEKERVELKIGGYIAKDWGRPLAAGVMGSLDWK